MTYHFTKILPVSFEEAIVEVTAALQQEGMGVLTQIDAQKAFLEKLGVEFRRYTILGACQPRVAYQMIELDAHAGVLFPCNVVVQEHENGQVEVSAVDPQAMFAAVANPEATAIARHASEVLQRVMARLPEAVHV
jgi:uncharacterized protein (DUF302 family)